MLKQKTNKNGSFAALISISVLLLLIILLENISDRIPGLPAVFLPTSQLFTVLKKGAVYSLVAVSMNLLNGFTGLFSLGQAGFMLIGAYASPARVYGTTEWTMQGFCLLAKERTMGACPMVAGGPDVGNWDADDKVPQEEENRAITASVAACINACDGYFLFDMIHLKKADQWSYVKTGIDGVIKKD